MERIESAKYLKHAWLCWKYTGRVPVEGKYKYAYMLYAILLNLLITIYYPLHLLLAVFNNSTAEEYMRTFSICMTCASTSIKFILMSGKLKQVLEVERILVELDARANMVAADRVYFGRIRKSIARIMWLFRCLFIPVGAMAGLSIILKRDRSLLYPGWFPFDWQRTALIYYATNFYQFVGISTQIWHNYAGDSVTAVLLCLLKGQIKLLGMRAARIGWDEEQSREDCEQELRRCIIDQYNLYKLIKAIHSIISLPMFVQFGVTAFNLGMTMAVLLFYSSSIYDKLYYMFCMLALPQQVFPSCYYGTNFQLLLSELHRDMFASNWIYQSRRYKKDMLLFVERSLKEDEFRAAGVVPISLDTFFATLKGTYSLLTLVLNYNDDNV